MMIDYTKHHYCTYCNTKYPLDVFRCTNDDCDCKGLRIRTKAKQKNKVTRHKESIARNNLLLKVINSA